MRERKRLPAGRPAEHQGFLIRSAVLSSYLQVASSVGLNAASMVRRVHLDRAVLTNSGILIPAVRVTELIELSARTARCRDFGLRLALARGVSEFDNPLHLLLREEPDIRSALRSMQRYLYDVHSHSLRVVFEEQGCPILRAALAEAAAPFAAPQAMEMIICSIFQVLQWLIGGRWRPAMVCFMHGPLGARDAHAAVFGCPVEFNHSFNGIVLSHADLDRPVQNSNPALRRHAETYLRILANGSTASFEEAVNVLIADLLPSRACTSTAVARHLGVDRSTMGRRLAAVGSSYSGSLQATRMRMANRLCLSEVALEQVGEQLGFASPSTFSRWFSMSFGCSARQWRRRYGGAGDGRHGESSSIGLDPAAFITRRT